MEKCVHRRRGVRPKMHPNVCAMYRRIAMSLDVGSPAPDFTLPNQDREPVTLSAQRGHPVVLAFFPAAFSSVCTTELCTFRDRLSTLNTARAQVYGISVDTFFTLKAFQTDQGLTFPLLSDFNKDGHPRLRRLQRGHDWHEGHRQARGLRDRRRTASSATARCWRTPGTSRLRSGPARRGARTGPGWRLSLSPQPSPEPRP